jgi:ATP-binding cassette, subfamily C (CFTR/MRP), member 1
MTIALVSLYDLLGPAMFPGVAVLILSIPLNALIARKIKLMNEQQMKNRDKRTKLMSELLANIKR